jgi:hypothetical protein
MKKDWVENWKFAVKINQRHYPRFGNWDHGLRGYGASRVAVDPLQHMHADAAKSFTTLSNKLSSLLAGTILITLLRALSGHFEVGSRPIYQH